MYLFFGDQWPVNYSTSSAMFWKAASWAVRLIRKDFFVRPQRRCERFLSKSSNLTLTYMEKYLFKFVEMSCHICCGHSVQTHTHTYTSLKRPDANDNDASWLQSLNGSPQEALFLSFYITKWLYVCLCGCTWEDRGSCESNFSKNKLKTWWNKQQTPWLGAISPLCVTNNILWPVVWPVSCLWMNWINCLTCVMFMNEQIGDFWS